MIPDLQTLRELQEMVNGIRTDIRATAEQVHALYDGDKRQQAISAAASTVAQVAELGLDQLESALAGLSDPPVPSPQAQAEKGEP